jgi:hypothetical protein
VRHRTGLDHLPPRVDERPELPRRPPKRLKVDRAGFDVAEIYRGALPKAPAFVRPLVGIARVSSRPDADIESPDE